MLSITAPGCGHHGNGHCSNAEQQGWRAGEDAKEDLPPRQEQGGTHTPPSASEAISLHQQHSGAPVLPSCCCIPCRKHFILLESVLWELLTLSCHSGDGTGREESWRLPWQQAD